MKRKAKATKATKAKPAPVKENTISAKSKILALASSMAAGNHVSPADLQALAADL